MAITISGLLVAALATIVVNGLPQGSPAVPEQPGDNNALIESLKTAPTALSRWQKLFTKDGVLLSKDELAKNIVYDFNNRNPAAAVANVQTFPVLTGLGISAGAFVLPACAVGAAHYHPRATEFLTVTDGEIDVGFIPEGGLVSSGSSEVAATIKRFQGTVFPMGSIHYQFNRNCDPATIVVGFSSEDPGASLAAQNFFGINGDIVRATLGNPEFLEGEKLETFRNNIPPGVAFAIEECMATCHGSEA